MHIQKWILLLWIWFLNSLICFLIPNCFVNVLSFTRSQFHTFCLVGEQNRSSRLPLRWSFSCEYKPFDFLFSDQTSGFGIAFMRICVMSRVVSITCNMLMISQVMASQIGTMGTILHARFASVLFSFVTKGEDLWFFYYRVFLWVIQIIMMIIIIRNASETCILSVARKEEGFTVQPTFNVSVIFGKRDEVSQIVLLYMLSWLFITVLNLEWIHDLQPMLLAITRQLIEHIRYVYFLPNRLFLENVN